MRHLLVALAAAPFVGPMTASVAGAFSGARGTPCRDAHLAPNARNAARIASATICLVNQQRALHRLRALRTNRALARIASGQAWDMVRGDYFADHSLGGRSPQERIVPALRPSHVRTTAQNIGWGTGGNATPEAIVRAWMNSPPHRQIILTGAYNEAGAGMTPSLPPMLGSRGATYALDLSALGK
jgi:uncharacterized protein YkwD